MRPCNDLENKTPSDKLESSVSICKCSGTQFFRTITRIQSGPDTFDELRSVTTFITFGVTEICSFRFFLEGETVKNIPESSRLEFLWKILVNNFVLLNAEENTFGVLNARGIADLPWLRTLLGIRRKTREPSC